MTNGHPTLPMGFEVTPEQRSEIGRISSILKRRLTSTPSDRQPIAVSLAKMLAAFPPRNGGKTAAEALVNSYFEALDGVPAWAVERASRDVVQGRASRQNDEWAPTPPAFAQISRKAMESDRRDLAQLDRIMLALSESGPSPEERERVSEGFDKLKATLVAEMAGDDGRL